LAFGVVLTGCASPPQPATLVAFEVELAHAPLALTVQPARAPVALGRIDDARRLDHRRRIGELYAPGRSPDDYRWA
jgi:hypothetical protein